MKVTVIGSGSIFFTRQLVKGMVKSALLTRSELALVDIDEHKCRQMGEFCKKVNAEAGGGLKISYTTDRCAALPGADYVVLTFAQANIHLRGVGVHVARKYGIHEASGDTAGPGSVFRIVRTIPEILEVARDIERLCPQALVLNYVNPTNVVGAALDRYSKLRWMSFCDGACLLGVGPIICRHAGLEPSPETFEKLEMKSGGINHFGWLFGLALNGKDLWVRFQEGLKAASDKAGPASRFRAEWELCRIMNAWPNVSWHAQEYVRYFQGRGRRPERDFVVQEWDLHERVRWTRQVWREIAQCNAGERSTKDIMAKLTPDMTTLILESILGDLKMRFPVNVRNEGRVSNLPADCVVELYGTFGKDRVDVPGIGPLPRGPLGMTHQVLDEQELALEAAMTGNYATLVRAIACDPLVMSLNDAEEITRDFLATDHEQMSPLWDSYWEAT